VALCGRDPDRLAQAVEEVRKAGGEVLARVVDVTDARALHSLFANIEAEWGGLDGLVNNAGVHTGSKFLDITDEQWQADFELKLLAAIRGTRLAAPMLTRSGAGAIVNILSVYAKFQPANSMPSSVFRAAGLALTKATAKELGKMGIRVNAVLLGYARTGQWSRAAAAEGIDEKEFERRLVRELQIPLGRAGHADDAAEAICFLLSSRSAYLTGTSLNVDGGLSPVT
jgi:NAD(P)-dependent dehydrogenase (short-subunit alcohol dehydrogenase family)